MCGERFVCRLWCPSHRLHLIKKKKKKKDNASYLAEPNRLHGYWLGVFILDSLPHPGRSFRSPPPSFPLLLLLHLTPVCPRVVSSSLWDDVCSSRFLLGVTPAFMPPTQSPAISMKSRHAHCTHALTLKKTTRVCS